MRVLVIGATGTIGKEVVKALQDCQHEVIGATRQSTPLKVDISDTPSIIAMFAAVRRVDAVVCAAGIAAFRPLVNLTDEDFRLSIANKLMGQVNVVRFGIDHVNDGGSFTLTSGILSRLPTPASAAVSMVNAGVEAFGRAAALELPRQLRVNVVSPGWVTETLRALKMDPDQGTPAAVVAKSYVKCVEGSDTGQVIECERA